MSKQQQPATTDALNLNVTLKDLVESWQNLKDLGDNKVSAQMSYTLGMVIRAVTPHLEQYEIERKKLIKQHIEPYDKTEDDKDAKRKARDKFDTELRALLETPAALNGIGRIRRSKFEAEGVSLDGNDSAVLHWLLKEDVAPVFDTD